MPPFRLLCVISPIPIPIPPGRFSAAERMYGEVSVNGAKSRLPYGSYVSSSSLIRIQFRNCPCSFKIEEELKIGMLRKQTVFLLAVTIIDDFMAAVLGTLAGLC
jgi:hypothetical protein